MLCSVHAYYLWLARQLIGLNQYFADANIFAHVTNSLLHCFARTQNRHAANLLAGHAFALVRNTLWSFDFHFFKRHQTQCVLDDQTNQTIRIENEFVTRCVLITDEGVEPFDLWRRWQ